MPSKRLAFLRRIDRSKANAVLGTINGQQCQGVTVRNPYDTADKLIRLCWRDSEGQE